MNSTRVKLLSAATLLWTALLLYLSLSPGPPQIAGPLGWDKLQHAFALGFLAFLAALVCQSLNISFKKAIFLGFISASFFGALIELLQGLCTSSREADIYDIFADVVGASIAVLFLIVRNTRKP
ncbi:VanZ family protein [Geobacter chapellei]|uniref:VanZ family protein n=1 Tax=Pelotalea chapellei TaxID=44671 RepID=A0ABS5UBF1_9BACT|nr:VanZ family protein [Pelotalea chapellei]